MSNWQWGYGITWIVIVVNVYNIYHLPHFFFFFFWRGVESEGAISLITGILGSKRKWKIKTQNPKTYFGFAHGRFDTPLRHPKPQLPPNRRITPDWGSVPKPLTKCRISLDGGPFPVRPSRSPPIVHTFKDTIWVYLVVAERLARMWRISDDVSAAETRLLFFTEFSVIPGMWQFQ